MLAAEGDQSGQAAEHPPPGMVQAGCAGPATWPGGWHLCGCSADRVDSELGRQLGLLKAEKHVSI